MGKREAGRRDAAPYGWWTNAAKKIWLVVILPLSVMNRKYRMIVKMKKTNKIIAVLAVFALALFAGCDKPAAPIDLPSDDAVTEAVIVTMNGEEIAVTEPDRIEAVMRFLRAAEPTRRQSVNDRPTNVASYGAVTIRAGGRTTVVYYYEKDGRHYVEQPYQGIYRTQDSLEDLFQEGD